MESIQLSITGMKCGGCVSTVEKILNDSDGIENVSVNLLTESAYFEISHKQIEIEKLLENLKKNGLDEKEKSILLTNDGINNVEKLFSDAGILKNNNFYDPENLHLVHHVNQALRANHLFEKGRDYIVKDGSLKIIDELTGRVLEGRRFGDGLHQALEAKEKI